MRRWESLSSLILAGALAGCGDGTGPDGNPRVFLESVVVEGVLQDRARAVGFAEDDGNLSSLDAFVDGELQLTMPLNGTRQQFSVLLPKAAAGSHQLRIEVSDGGGRMGQTATQFTVPEPVPVYDATVYMLRHDRIDPVPGTEFCLAEFCSVTGSDGKVLLKDFDLRPSYEVSFIEGAHPHYLAAIGKSRLDPNLINFVNGHALSGMTPVDTAVHIGMNERKIVYIDSLTVPIQEFIDQFHQEMGRNFNFMHPFLDLYISERHLSVDPTIADSLKAAAYRGLAFANARYQDVPHDDPVTYTMPFQGTIPGTLIGEEAWGKVIIFPTPEGGLQGGMDLEVLPDGSRNLRSLKIWVNVSDTFRLGKRAVQYYIEMLTGASLSGVAWGPLPSYGTFIQHFWIDSQNMDLDRTWTERDRQVAIIDLMFDSESPFTPTGHVPDLTSALGRGSFSPAMPVLK